MGNKNKIFKVNVRGYDTCEWRHIDKTIDIEASNKEEAEEKAKQWCSDNSYMGGYDWTTLSIDETEDK